MLVKPIKKQEVIKIAPAIAPWSFLKLQLVACTLSALSGATGGIAWAAQDQLEDAGIAVFVGVSATAAFGAFVQVFLAWRVGRKHGHE